MNMKNTFALTALTMGLAIACTLVSTVAYADDGYPKNPILRPITLTDNTLAVTAIIGHSTEVDGDKKWYAAPALHYGVTDNFMVGSSGLTYRVWQNDGLEVALNTGFKGSFDSDEFGDSVGFGGGVFGKKVINNNLALTFGVDYIHWAEDVLDDKSEVDYSLGVMFNIAPEWTVGGNYTFRDLKDFSQDNANVFRMSLSYAMNDDIDLGIYAANSDYEEVVNNHYLHDEFEETAGVFMNWRF
jgi:hypothetical protein